MARRKKSFLEKFFNVDYDREEMKFNRIMLLEMCLSLLFIIIGVLLFASKISSEGIIRVIIGTFVLAEAIICFISFKSNRNNKLFVFNIIFAVLFMIIALLFYTNLFKFLEFIKIYSSLFFIIAGIKYGYNGIILKSVNEETYLITLTSAIIVFALGGISMFFVFNNYSIYQVLGIFTVLYGMINISISNLLRNRICKFMSKVDND